MKQDKNYYKIYYNKFIEDLKNNPSGVKKFLDTIPEKYFNSIYENIVAIKDIEKFKIIVNFSNDKLSQKQLVLGLWNVSFDTVELKRFNRFKSILNLYKKLNINIDHKSSISESVRIASSVKLYDYYFTKFPSSITNENIKLMLEKFSISDSVNMIDWMFNNNILKITKNQKLYALKSSMIMNKKKLVLNYIIESEFSKPIGKSIVINDKLLKEVRPYRNHPEYEILENRKLQQDLTIKHENKEIIKRIKI